MLTRTINKQGRELKEWLDFIAESNRIEGITRQATNEEVAEFCRFMALPVVNREDLIQFVSVYQPGAVLRDRPGLNVRVGNHFPPLGGPHITRELDSIVNDAHCCDPHSVHVRYETIHPFTDGNGRSGRMLWAWMMKRFPLGFLHHFYYQTLAASSERVDSRAQG